MTIVHACIGGDCCHCGRRIGPNDAFIHRGHGLCCECMSELCSWLLDGGMIEDPAQFDYVQADHG